MEISRGGGWCIDISTSMEISRVVGRCRDKSTSVEISRGGGTVQGYVNQHGVQ